MAKFDTAFVKTMKYEGGYVNDKNDQGGETYKGVSRVNWPKWEGWSIIDSLKGQSDFSEKLESNQKLQQLVYFFYQENFFEKIGGSKILNDHLAEEIFDTAVNNGIGTAIKLTQEALQIPISGKMDDSFVNALNKLV
jgi:lysozyme family protein